MSVRTSKLMFLQVRIRKPKKKKVRAQTVNCYHVGTVLGVISYTSPHLTSTKSNKEEIVIALDSNGLRGEMSPHSSAGR